MERDQHQQHPGAVRPREDHRAPGGIEEDERIVLDDVDDPPGENPPIDDV